jgi:hypothetical protein
MSVDVIFGAYPAHARACMPGAAVDTEPRMSDIRALVLDCTLEPAPAESSTDLIGSQVLDELRRQGAEGEVVGVVDQRVRFGVSTDEGGRLLTTRAPRRPCGRTRRSRPTRSISPRVLKESPYPPS